MDPIRELAVLKILGDSFRAALLRRLMARALTLTQLGEELGESPAHIRHHLKALEGAGLVELVSVRPVRGFLEKYYRATAAAFLVQLAILPEDPRGGRAPVISSNDLALQQLRGAGEEPPFTLLPQDSLDGLVRLREGVCDMA
ncbi:MAG TPA: winged helix-turn-helix domain-containing protein, partial [Anaerolineaceae bacterium]